MNVAITGACGLLGAHLAAALSGAHRVVGFDRHAWWGTRAIEVHQGDLADAGARRDFLADARPDILIHCAALVNVDACEKEPARAYEVNGMLTGQLAREVPRECLVVYVTTDGIFPGDEPMRTEIDLPCPRTVYGRSKLHGEWETGLATPNHLIVRTNFYGWSAGVKSTSAEWLYHALESGVAITLFDDFWFTPIYVVELVERLFALIGGGRRGTYNLVGSERVSKHDFGTRLASAAGFGTANVRRGSIADAHLPAPRPKDMSLSSAKLALATGRDAPDCAAGLARFIADRGRPLEQRFSSAYETIG